MSLALRDPRDPPVREDGICAVCEKQRKPERSRKYGRAVAETDPFCSADCARAWYAARPSLVDDEIKRLARDGVSLNAIKTQLHVGINRVYSTLGVGDDAA